MKFNKEDIVFLSLVTAVIFAICGLLIYCNHAIDERDLTIEQMEIKIEELYQENEELKNVETHEDELKEVKEENEELKKLMDEKQEYINYLYNQLNKHR